MRGDEISIELMRKVWKELTRLGKRMEERGGTSRRKKSPLVSTWKLN